MAAVVAEGDTVIRNAASEPHVQELCLFLNQLGAQIEEIGSNTLHIHGVTGLRGGEFTIGPDYLEVISFVHAHPELGHETLLSLKIGSSWAIRRRSVLSAASRLSRWYQVVVVMCGHHSVLRCSWKRVIPRDVDPTYRTPLYPWYVPRAT